MLLRKGRDGTFHKEREGMTRSSLVIATVLVVSFFILSVVWFIFVSGFWRVTEISIDGLQGLDRGEVVSSTYEALDQGTWKPWDQRNILLIDEKEVEDGLRDRLFAESVAVEKSYPNVLRLMIKERQRSVVVAAGSQLLNVDTTGVVTGETQGDDAAQSRLRLNNKALADFIRKPVITTNLAEPAVAGYQITDERAVKRWIESYRTFIGAGMKFRYIHLMSPTSTTAYVASDAGYQVIIDLLEPLQPQVETYLKFLKSKPKNFKINEYVDVRVPGKLYVK